MFKSKQHSSSNQENKPVIKPDANKSYTVDELEEIILSSSLSENSSILQQIFSNANDLVIKNLAIGKKNKMQATVLYFETLVDTKMIDNNILRPLTFETYSSDIPSEKEIINLLKSGNLLISGQVTVCNNMKDLTEKLLSGNTCLLIDGLIDAYTINTPSNESRSIDEAKTEAVIRGPKDSFVETLNTNLTLIRKRIQSPNLAIESVCLGTETKTKVCIAYMKGICPHERVTEVLSRVGKINIDGILESGYIEEFIQDHPYSIFPQVRNTERPDTVAASLLEGRVAIITNNTPIVLIVPGEFLSLMQSAEDYYERYIFATLVRLLRYVALLIATFLPAFYIAVTNFHEEMIPTDLLISISSARTGVPIPTFIEAMAMYTAFELLYEAGIRLPKNLGQTVSIVGALIIGQAAVQANVISPLMVIVVALTGITTFCIPQYNIAITSRILRFVFMILSAMLGLFGLMIGVLFLLLHLSSLRSFGVPYFMPLFPLNTNALKDTFVRAPWWAMIKRPSYVTPNKKRMKTGQRPRPPRI